MSPKILIPLLLFALTSTSAMGEDHVVQIRKTKYTLLKDAVENHAQAGDTLTIIDNFTTEEHIQIKNEITLDLNGKTIDYKPTSSGTTASPLLNVLSSGNLTIIDSNSENGKIICNNNDNSKSFAYINVEGTCTINGGTYSYNVPTKGCTLVNVISGTLTINNGRFSTCYGATVGGAINNQGNTIINSGTIINSCDVTTKAFASLNTGQQLSASTAVYNQKGSLSINGGTIQSNQHAVWVASGTANLSSCANYKGLIKNGDDGKIIFILSDNVNFKDNDSTILNSAKSIYYTRTTNSTWGTVCLPFSPDKNDNITYYSIKNIGSTDIGASIDVTEVEQPIANTPYLFMLKSGNVFQATAKINGKNGQTISISDEAKSVSSGDNSCILKGAFETTSVCASKEIGDTLSNNYKKIIDGQNAFYIAGNEIHPINQYFNIRPYRAYFVLPSNTNTSSSNCYQVAILDELTGINSVKDAEQSKTIVGIYTINGLKRDYLQKGINIVRYSDGSSQTINVLSR